MTGCEQNRDRKLFSFSEKLLLHFYVLSFLNVTGFMARKAFEQPDKYAATLGTSSSMRKQANIAVLNGICDGFLLSYPIVHMAPGLWEG